MKRTIALTALWTCLALPGFAQTSANALGAPPPLSVYGNLPATDDVALSANAQRVALVMDKDGKRLIYDYDFATGKAAATEVNFAKIRQLFWADSDHVVAIVSHTVRPWYDESEAVEGYTGHILNMPEKSVRDMIGTATTGEYLTGDFHRIVMDNKAAVTASQGDKLVGFSLAGQRFHTLDNDEDDNIALQNWAISADGELIARSAYSYKAKEWSLQFRDGKKWRTVLTRPESLHMPRLVGLGRTAGTALLYLMEDGQPHGFYEVSAAGETGTALATEGNNAEPVYNPKTGYLAGFQTEREGVYAYAFSDPAMVNLPRLIDKAFADYPIKRIVDFADDPHKMVVFAEGNGDAGTYFFVDFTTGKSRAIGETYPELPAEWVAEQESITYKAADGLEIPAIVTYPPGREGNKLPLIVLPHGGPLGVHDTLGFDWLAQALASRGYVVLQPNFRGSGGYTEAFANASTGEFGRKMQTDLSDGVRTLVADGLIDAKRVCIVGASYGGYAALAGATIDTGVYRCAVSIAGISDVRKLVYPQGGEKLKVVADSLYTAYWKRLLGDDIAGWDARSPAHFAAKVDIPLLMIHGKDDSVVPLEQTLAMRDAMKEAKKPFELKLLDKEDHWLSRAETRTQTLETVVTFLEKNNPAY